jgi:hypothetical protein
VAVSQIAAARTNDGLAVACGPGRRAVGGGITGGGGWLVASGPLDEHGTFAETDDGDVAQFWYSEISNTEFSPQTNTFYVICSASSDATIQKQQFTADPAFNASNPKYASDVVACPDGQRALSGGVSYRDNRPWGTNYLEATGPMNETMTIPNTENGDAARYWAGLVRNDSPTADQTYAVYALCSPTSQATLKLWTQSLFSNSPHLACPTGSRATGGGMLPPDSNAVDMRASGPTDASGAPSTLATGDAPRGWFTEGGYHSVNSTIGMYSAVCDPASAAAPPGPTGQRDAALKKCKKKHSRKARRKCRKKAALLPV